MGVFRRFRNTVAGSSADAGLDDEVRFHIDERTQEYIREGLTPDEARARAVRLFGNQTLIAERTRDFDRLYWLDSFLRDLRGAVRGLVKNPGFTAVALLTLAIGIGGNAAMFSMIHGVLLRPLAYREPDRLVSIARGQIGTTVNRGVSMRRFEATRKGATSFSALGAYLSPTEDVLISGRGVPDLVRGARVSANVLDVLGARPETGRSFLPEEDVVGGPPVAMISAALWRRRFAADPMAIGAAVTLNSRPFTIVGVLPDSFQFPYESVDLWFPQPSEMTSLAPEFRTCCAPLRLFARLAPGTTLEQARAQLRVLNEREAAAYPQAPDSGPLDAALLKHELTSNVSTMLWVLLAAVGFVLLIGCANIAVLLLARATSRSREIAVRAALGATKGQLLRQFLTESMLLAAAGGILGLLVSSAAINAIRQMTIFDLLVPARSDSTAWSVVSRRRASLAASCSLRYVVAHPPDLMHKLRQAATTSGTLDARGTRASARAALVIAQVALSIVPDWRRPISPRPPPLEHDQISSRSVC